MLNVLPLGVVFEVESFSFSNRGSIYSAYTYSRCGNNDPRSGPEAPNYIPTFSYLDVSEQA